jgi:hypothetical protein
VVRGVATCKHAIPMVNICASISKVEKKNEKLTCLPFKSLLFFMVNICHKKIPIYSPSKSGYGEL